MRQSFEFIVLAATKVGDSSMVLHTLSPEFGRRSFICSVGKSTPTALFQPLNILSGVYTENTKSDLWRIGSLKAEYPLLGIRTSVGKNAMTMFHRYVTTVTQSTTPSQHSKVEFSYMIACTIGSTLGVLHKWTRENFQVPTEVIADLLTQIFISGMLPFMS